MNDSTHPGFPAIGRIFSPGIVQVKTLALHQHHVLATVTWLFDILLIHVADRSTVTRHDYYGRALPHGCCQSQCSLIKHSSIQAHITTPHQYNNEHPCFINYTVTRQQDPGKNVLLNIIFWQMCKHLYNDSLFTYSSQISWLPCWLSKQARARTRPVSML